MTNTNELNGHGQTVFSKQRLFLAAVVAFMTVSVIFFTAKAFANVNGATSTAEAINESDSAMNSAFNGTFPTVLQSSVSSANASQMKVQGRYTTIGGRGIAAMRVDIYSVAEGSFARLSTAYTDGNGNFDVTVSKPPVGRLIQIGIEGNGTYNKPLPTYGRP